VLLGARFWIDCAAMTAALGCVVLAISKDLASNHPRRGFHGGAWSTRTCARYGREPSGLARSGAEKRKRSPLDVNATANVRCVASLSGSLDPPVAWTGRGLSSAKR